MKNLLPFPPILIALFIGVSISHAADATWNVQSGAWATGASWAPTTPPGATTGTTSGDTATFGSVITANVTVTVDPNRNIKNIVFDSAAHNYFLGTGNLLLTNGGAITAQGVTNGRQGIGTAITLEGDGGSYSFINNSTGNGAQNIENTVVGVSTGTNVTTLTLGGTGTQTGTVNTAHRAEVSGVIGDGTGGGKLALNKTGAGIWYLSAANTYTGGTAINAGVLELAAFASLPNSGTGTTVASGATLAAAVGGTSTITSSNVAALAGNTSFASGSFLGVDTALGNFTESDNLTGAFGLTKLGVNTLTLTGANTYTGATTVSAGTLQISSGGSVTGNIVNNGTLQVGNGNTVGSVTGNIVNNATLQIGNGGTGGSVTGNIVNNATLNFFRSNASTYSGVISGTGGLSKIGGGALTLTGANTYTGTTALTNNGTLALDFSAAGAPTTNIINNTANSSALTTSGGRLVITGAAGAADTQQFNSLTVSGGGGTLTAMAGTGGTLGVSLGAITGGTYTGANTTVTGPAAGSAAAFAINKNAGATVTSLTAADPNTSIYSGRFVINNNDGNGWNFVTSAETVAGSGVYALAPFTNYADLPLSGTVATNGGNTALIGSAATTGAITLNTLRIDTDTTAGEGLTLGGDLTLSAAAAGGSASSPGAILFVGADNYTISGANLVRNNSIPRSIIIQQYGTGVLTINSTITNSGASTTLAKAGPGELVLGGTNSYAGSTNIQEGILTVSSDSNLGVETAPSPVNIYGGATLRAAGTFALENAAAPTGNMRPVALNGLNAAVDVTGTNVFTINGVVSGASGSLNKTGIGTLALGGANTYAIGTTIAGGTLLVNNTTGSGTGTGTVTVAAGATLGGTGTISGVTTINGMLSVGAVAGTPAVLTFSNTGTALTLASTANSTFDITGAGGVRGTNFDAITVGGALAYGGTLTINLGSFTPASGSSYDLADFGSESGTFSSIVVANGAYNGMIDYTTGILTLTAVPEPSTWVSMITLAAAAGVYRQRRSRWAGAR